jgi:hypothetical protein
MSYIFPTSNVSLSMPGAFKKFQNTKPESKREWEIQTLTHTDSANSDPEDLKGRGWRGKWQSRQLSEGRSTE